MVKVYLVAVVVLLNGNCFFCGGSSGKAWGQSATGASKDPARTVLARGKVVRTDGDDWATFLGPHGSGVSDETGILTDWSDGKLAVVWKKSIRSGYGIGAVAGGRYFQFDGLPSDRQRGDRQQGQARVRCWNAETGAELWEFRYSSRYRDLYGYDNGPRTSPVVDGERVYVFGVEGMLHCLSASTGREIWKRDTAEEFGVVQNFFGVASTPVVAGDWLLVMVGGSPPESRHVPAGALDRVKPNGSGIVAFDKRTGKIRYRIANELASYTGLRLATLGGQSVGYAWLRGALIGFEIETGKIFLEYPYRHRKLESVNASTPVVKRGGKENQVFLSECYGLGSVLLSVTRDSHKAIWQDRGRRKKSMEAHWNTPILVGESLFGCSGRHSGGAELRCVDWRTGNVKWKKAGFARCSLTAVDGHFVLLDETGRLVLIRQNAEHYQQVTEYGGEIRFKSPCWAAPIVSHGLMYVRGRDQVVCFELIPEKKKREN